eukprot:COSAG02_NODE_745_length_17738_cov_18.178241_7_plen_306_part_00
MSSAAFSPQVVTTPACIEVLLADAQGSTTEDSGWNGSQEVSGCDQLKPDRAKCPLITMKGEPGHFDASASGAWQNRPIALAKFGQMSLDYSPVLTGTIVCPADGRAEIHWKEITPGYWKSATAATAAACRECLDGSTRWGQSFLTVLLLVVLCYVVGGVVYNVKRSGARIGMEALPHRAFWLEVFSLVRDGVAFARAPNQRSNYSTISKTPSVGEVAGGAASAARDPPAVQKKEKRDSRGKKSSGSGTQEESNAHKNERPKKNRPAQRAPASASLVDTSGEPAAGGSGSASTPSGGGGRWVHVPM